MLRRRSFQALCRCEDLTYCHAPESFVPNRAPFKSTEMGTRGSHTPKTSRTSLDPALQLLAARRTLSPPSFYQELTSLIVQSAHETFAAAPVTGIDTLVWSRSVALTFSPWRLSPWVMEDPDTWCIHLRMNAHPSLS